jgi:hypothetical protein
MEMLKAVQFLCKTAAFLNLKKMHRKISRDTTNYTRIRMETKPSKLQTSPFILTLWHLTYFGFKKGKVYT